MKPLDQGESPVFTVRLPDDLVAAVRKAAGPGHGARSRWIREVIKTAVTGATDPGHGPSTCGCTHRKATR